MNPPDPYLAVLQVPRQGPIVYEKTGRNLDTIRTRNAPGDTKDWYRSQAGLIPASENETSLQG